jgi:hypothetical protein
MKRLIQGLTIMILSLMMLLNSAAIAAEQGAQFTTAQSAKPRIEEGIPNPDALFKPSLSDLQMTGIPLRLPTYIPKIGQRLKDPKAKPETLPLYGHLDQATPNRYQVTIGHTPTCEGGNVCRLGTIAATRITKGTPSISEEYASRKDPNYQGKKSKELMSSVQLAKGIQGTFVPWVCGASCTDAEVVWDEAGYRYSVGIKVGDRASLVEMANSAIERKP